MERLEVSGTDVFSWVSPGEDKSNHCHFLTEWLFLDNSLRFRLSQKVGVGIFRHLDSSRTPIYHIGDSSFLPEKINNKVSDFSHL